MKLQTKLLLSLFILAVLDAIVPIPFLALLLMFVVLEKPPWFKQLADDLCKSQVL